MQAVAISSSPKIDIQALRRFGRLWEVRLAARDQNAARHSESLPKAA